MAALLYEAKPGVRLLTRGNKIAFLRAICQSDFKPYKYIIAGFSISFSCDANGKRGETDTDYDIIDVLDKPYDTDNGCIWNTMDVEPPLEGVILYSKPSNRVYDAQYIGDGMFMIERLTVPSSCFSLWARRLDVIEKSGLKEARKLLALKEESENGTDK